MQDRKTQINLTKLIAALFTSLGLALMTANIFTEGEDLGFFGVAGIAFGAVLRIRSYFVAVLDQRRDMFELGRESTKVRAMR